MAGSGGCGWGSHFSNFQDVELKSVISEPWTGVVTGGGRWRLWVTSNFRGSFGGVGVFLEEAAISEDGCIVVVAGDAEQWNVLTVAGASLASF